MSKKIIQNQLRRVLNNELKETVKPFTLIRNIPNTVTPEDPVEPYYDPVTEEWIYPEASTDSGNPTLLTKELKGVFRRMKSSIMDRYSLSNSDRALTIDYDNYMEAVASNPQIDDKIITVNDGDFRVVGWEKDPMDIFIKLYLRRNP